MIKIQGLSGDWTGDGTLLEVGCIEQTPNNEAREEMEIKHLGKVSSKRKIQNHCQVVKWRTQGDYSEIGGDG